MSARDNILAKLRGSLQGTQPLADNFDEALVTEPWRYPPTERVARLRTLMEMVHTETHLTTTADWPAQVERVLAERGLDQLLIAPGTPHGARLVERWQDQDQPRWKAYDRPVEEWKAELFNDTPASLTGTLGALASTGSLVLWPDRQEPRLMSLVPPLHIALLRASTVVDNFYELQQQHRWQDGMPTNALLISGPSKTADIEQVLAYGAHGPKDLVVLIVENE
ncbi:MULTISPECIES: lactate utilization protein C [Pseudomonas]|uniref:LutC/YkgG family protein n=1 Tax=Pseudomonas TaxID=286 RepID=UPI0002D88896|nr:MULTISPECIES: lactate utilization protein C [Pseudomonas]MDC7830028.1 lactate utilization protein C [Pseudomonas benzopyrenica]MXS19375.1 lactate utilization protein [Pseudomonas oryzihabitans]NRH40692.1 lactate utilization protein C [Pseudomonas sp. MS15a(2019)]SEO50526.1 L-lactate dehydrogenase complex protein LldG [Pseudomonas sp. Snoq117.2]